MQMPYLLRTEPKETSGGSFENSRSQHGFQTWKVCGFAVNQLLGLPEPGKSPAFHPASTVLASGFPTRSPSSQICFSALGRCWELSRSFHRSGKGCFPQCHLRCRPYGGLKTPAFPPARPTVLPTKPPSRGAPEHVSLNPRRWQMAACRPRSGASREPSPACARRLSSQRRPPRGGCPGPTEPRGGRGGLRVGKLLLGRRLSLGAPTVRE